LVRRETINASSHSRVSSSDIRGGESAAEALRSVARAEEVAGCAETSYPTRGGAVVSESIVETRGLTKRYGAFTAVAGLDLDVARGELFALLGPNGAGKTTTMRLLMGILKATQGAARIDGLDCFRDRVEVKRRVGYLPDDPIFADYLRGIEIVHFVGGMHGLSPPQIDARARPLFERLELADATDEYAVNYSRGMKKKLAFICAVLHEPALLILDEPTSGLDPIASRRLNEMLVEAARGGTTILLSSHLLDQVQKLCQRMAIIRHGTLAAVGTLNELRQQATAESSLEEVFFAVAGAGAESPDAPPGAP
jgi:ABC-2 type transport system ATP-binding protein